jgi:hypothetical protein
MKNLLKLTDAHKDIPIIIGASSIIDAKRVLLPNKDIYATKIESRGAMVTTNWVIETIDEILNQYNKHD